MSDDYVIRVPAECLEVDGTEAYIHERYVDGPSMRSFQILGTVPHDALGVRMDYERPLQPGETRDMGNGMSVHMHAGDGCGCHPEGGAFTDVGQRHWDTEAATPRKM